MTLTRRNGHNGEKFLVLGIYQRRMNGYDMSRISAAAGVYGEDAIAAMGIVLRIVTLGVNVVFGYMKGFQPMAGFNYGAKNYSRLNEAIRSCMKWTTIFCVAWPETLI